MDSREVAGRRRPTRADFEGRTIKIFEPLADNAWRIWFTDGGSVTIQCEGSAMRIRDVQPA